MNDATCKYSNGILPYMYGEMVSPATDEFESHLLECQACTDEFAALSAARYEVYDWKKLEFDPLATPAIAIPYGEASTAVSWVEKLRTAFAGNWAMPTAAFAGLAIVSVFVALLVVPRGVDEVASIDNSNTPANRPAANTPNQNQPSPTVATETDQIQESTPARQPSRPTLVREPSPRRPMRTQQSVAPKNIEARTTVTAPNAPRLNEFVEEEDDSLRLAELLEDVDTSE